MQIMECRHLELDRAIKAFQETGVPLISGSEGTFSAAGHSDNVGIYYAVPWIVRTFDIPLDWEKSIINASANLYYIRARITTVYSTNPVYDQGFIAAVGTEVGSGSIFEQDVAITTEIVTAKFGDEANAKPPILRGTQETLEIHLSADSFIDGFIEWTEN